ncbi:MAG: TRM11 family SAM-dependent methyltransferase [Propionibacteriaceae bacterium]
MSEYLLLLAPSANHVYAGQAARLAAAELALCIPGAIDVAPTTLAGVDYLGFTAGDLEPADIARLSASLALFERIDEALLIPQELPRLELFDTDLVSIPKYPGKTNEQFTRLLVNLTLAACETTSSKKVILDPMCGRATTLMVGWQLGLHGAGVEADAKSVEAFCAYLKTYLRRKRLKHAADMTPVRRDGHPIGERFDAEAKEQGCELTIFTGDTRDSQLLFGKKKFDLIVTDAPYGIVHGSKPQLNIAQEKHRKDRSPAALLHDAVPVWVSQLKPGGALGISWNTYGLSREDLVDLLLDEGLIVHNDGAWLDFAHRVDASINRDLVVATLPAGPTDA